MLAVGFGWVEVGIEEHMVDFRDGNSQRKARLTFHNLISTLQTGKFPEFLSLEKFADDRVIFRLLLVTLQVDCLANIRLLGRQFAGKVVQKFTEELLGVLLLVVVKARYGHYYRTTQITWPNRN